MGAYTPCAAAIRNVTSTSLAKHSTELFKLLLQISPNSKSLLSHPLAENASSNQPGSPQASQPASQQASQPANSQPTSQPVSQHASQPLQNQSGLEGKSPSLCISCFTHVKTCTSTQEICTTERGAESFVAPSRLIQTGIVNAACSAIFDPVWREKKPERKSRALWRHQGKPDQRVPEQPGRLSSDTGASPNSSFESFGSTASGDFGSTSIPFKCTSTSLRNSPGLSQVRVKS